MKWFGREPAQWLAFLAIVVQLAVAVGVPLSEQQQAGVNAAATAVMAAILAWTVNRGAFAALAGGAVATVGQLAISLGVDVTQEKIAAFGAAVTAGLALWLYGKVTAPVSGEQAARKTPTG